jgi:hypothetical protein
LDFFHNQHKLHTSRFIQFRPQTQNMNFSGSREKISEKNGLRFFESRLKRKLGKHRRESWLTSSRNFEVLGVKLKQTLFFDLILKKYLEKIEKVQKLRFFFVLIWVVLCFQNIND